MSVVGRYRHTINASELARATLVSTICDILNSTFYLFYMVACLSTIFLSILLLSQNAKVGPPKMLTFSL